LFDRPRSAKDAGQDGTVRAVLVHPVFTSHPEHEVLEEFRELTLSAGALPVAEVVCPRKAPDAKYLIGSGKAEEVRLAVEREQAALVLVDFQLSPSQERNLERLLSCRVLDRTGLILDIFAQRATSHEGRLQVELAQLKHLSTRLVRGWTHLERQKGGIGLRGPGETQLETDRRLIAGRIKQLNKRLEKVRHQRDQGRRARHKAELPTVSLVGYTNAGKSTLFNRLTASGVYAADQLFATLDPTLRRVALPNSGPVILADTVGFIRHLPHDLVAAFRSTLEETRQADLLLHVIDAHNEQQADQIQQVNAVLQEIDAGAIPQLQVMNKVDLLADGAPRIDRDEAGVAQRVWLSAATGAGIELLLQALAERFNTLRQRAWVRVPPAGGRLRARLYALGTIHQECVQDNGDWLLEVELARKDFASLEKNEGLRRCRDEDAVAPAAETRPEPALINGCG
jgi:GTP-binding protein HflX